MDEATETRSPTLAFGPWLVAPVVTALVLNTSQLIQGLTATGSFLLAPGWVWFCASLEIVLLGVLALLCRDHLRTSRAAAATSRI